MDREADRARVHVVIELDTLRDWAQHSTCGGEVRALPGLRQLISSYGISMWLSLGEKKTLVLSKLFHVPQSTCSPVPTGCKDGFGENKFCSFPPASGPWVTSQEPWTTRMSSSPRCTKEVPTAAQKEGGLHHRDASWKQSPRWCQLLQIWILYPTLLLQSQPKCWEICVKGAPCDLGR